MQLQTLFRPADGDETPRKPKLFTPLHQAAHGQAPRAVVQKLLELGAKRSLKTQSGKTTHDIAKAFTVPREEVLDLLKVPAEVSDNRETIDKMEKALHEKVIRGEERNAAGLIKEHNLQLPQLAVLWEPDGAKDGMWFPVPGMYGGFRDS